jgi:hypothetical protein
MYAHTIHTPFHNQHRKALEDLRARMSGSPLGCPDDDLLRWYLRDRYFKVDAAEEKLASMLMWRQQERWVGGRGAIWGGSGAMVDSVLVVKAVGLARVCASKLMPHSPLNPPCIHPPTHPSTRPPTSIDAIDVSSPEVQRELATGKAEVHSATDRYGRPVVIIRVKQHVIGEWGGLAWGGLGRFVTSLPCENVCTPSCPCSSRPLLPFLCPIPTQPQINQTPLSTNQQPQGEYPIADSKRLAGYVLDQAVASLPPGGEQIMGLFDLRGFELKNADLQFAAFIIEAFFEYYPRRWGGCLVMGLLRSRLCFCNVGMEAVAET